MRETQGLTKPSSATEAGEARLDCEKTPAASLCSLERVVRPVEREPSDPCGIDPVPAGTKAGPMGRGCAPAGRGCAPAGGRTLPVGARLDPAGRRWRPGREEGRPGRENASPGRGRDSAGGGTARPGREKVRPGRENGCGDGENAFPGGGNDSPGRENDCWPNGLKLSDRGWPRKTWIAEKTGRPASVRWSAWLGPRLQSVFWKARRNRLPLRRGKDGRCRRERLNGGTGWPEGWTDRQSERQPTCRQREIGNRRAIEEHRAKTQGLTDPSSATAGRKASHQSRTPPRRSLERVVRRVNLGVWTPEEPTAHRRGNDGRCRREGPTKAGDAPGGKSRPRSEREPARHRRKEREPTCLGKQSREEERLTPPSSATEAGENRRRMQERPAASLCSLERVVRGRPRRKGVETGKTWLKRAKTTVVCDKPPKRWAKPRKVWPGQAKVQAGQRKR